MNKEEVATLIPAFGESSAHDWLEPRYSIWVGPSHTTERPAVQGYATRDGWCLCWGNPLAVTEDLGQVAKDLLAWAEQHSLAVLWCCVDNDLQHILSTLDYSVVSCIKEDTIDPLTVKWTSNDLKKNIRKAERAGVQIIEKTAQWTLEERAEVDEGVKNWKNSRNGEQVASDSLAPWMDEIHRRYWIAQTPAGQIVGLMVLAPLKNGGYLIKNSLVFPDAPTGVSEQLNAHVIINLRKEGSSMVTFGVSAADSLVPISNVGGVGMTFLSKTYGVIAQTTGVTKRSTYRKKFAPREDSVYICYPPSGLGWSGIQALMKMLRPSK